MAIKRVLLGCGVIGPIFFTSAYLLEGATRPGYDPMRDPVSSLALGEMGWTQTVTFLVTGALVVAFAFGLRGYGRALPILMAIVGLGFFGAGVFATDPVTLYPPGSSIPAQPSTTGRLHDVFSLGVFFGLPLAMLVATRRFDRIRRPVWVVCCILAAASFFVLFVLAGTGFTGDMTFAPIGGLMQRLSLSVGLAWVVALALLEYRRAQKR
jgi:hypothetical membrane protein